MNENKTAKTPADAEPAAWLIQYKTRHDIVWGSAPGLRSHDQILGMEPLYIAPPKREWVGLTDEEAWGVYKTHGLSFHRPNHVEEYEWALCLRDFSKAIEAKLKEKNSG